MTYAIVRALPAILILAAFSGLCLYTLCHVISVLTTRR